MTVHIPTRGSIAHHLERWNVLLVMPCYEAVRGLLRAYLRAVEGKIRKDRPTQPDSAKSLRHNRRVTPQTPVKGVLVFT